MTTLPPSLENKKPRWAVSRGFSRDLKAAHGTANRPAETGGVLSLIHRVQGLTHAGSATIARIHGGLGTDAPKCRGFPEA